MVVECIATLQQKDGLKAQCDDSPGQRPGLSMPDALRAVW